ncbi:MAG: hypothetical protein ACTHMG_10550 [Sphingomonas sp.]
MRRHALLFTAMACSIAMPVWAECPGATDGTGVAHQMSVDRKSDTDLVLSMSLMPRLMHLDYKSAAKQKLDCEMTQFKVGDETYDLKADPVNAGTSRVALPTSKGAPIAELVPVVKITDIIASHGDKPTSPSGYMLATLTRQGVTGWRYYPAMPSQATLSADMIDALNGQSRPLFRSDTKSGKTEIYVPK